MPMPMELGQMKYLVLTRENLSNQVRERTLRTKCMEEVCWYILENVGCQYDFMDKITVDRGELNIK